MNKRAEYSKNITGKEACHLEAVSFRNYTALLVDETNMSKLHL
jgi:hypothetical protein